MQFTKKALAPLVANPISFIETLAEEDLVALYQRLSHAYYNTSKPLVSDDIFDIVQAALKKRHPKHPILKSVGASVADDDKRKIKLPVWMGSLDKVKNEPKVLEAFKAKYPGSYVVSDKLDGVSALFVLNGGGVGGAKGGAALYTRGDGEVGQDISHLLPFINGIPAKMPSGAAGLMVRGELIMTRAAFEAGGKGANARNTVSGLVNAKVPDLDVAKNVGFVAYENFGLGLGAKARSKPSPSVGLGLLAKMNFNVVPHKVLGSDGLTLENLSATLMDRRAGSAYEIDGLVVAHDAAHDEAPGKNPDAAFAFKHLITADTAEVVVTEVVWSPSKDGLIKPVVEFDPVRLSGVTIRRATGFNAAFIRDGRIGPGARLLITRSGDVIPYIMQVLAPADEPSMPASYKYAWAGSKDIKLMGNSAEVDVKQLENFFDKLDVKGLRRATVQKLFDGGVKTVREFMDLKQAALEAVPGFANKWPLVAEAHAGIRAAPCLKLMNASNAFGMGFGERKLRAIAAGIPSVLNAAADLPTVDELVAIDGIAPLTAGKFIEGLAAFRQWLRDSGLHCSASAPAAAKKRDKSPGPAPSRARSPARKATLAGEVVVFTGFRNQEWSDRIEELGGEVGSGVTKKTTILVAKEVGGDKESGKLAAARAKGIRVMDREAFERMI
jgi:NAD-dependent DNA ligase